MLISGNTDIFLDPFLLIKGRPYGAPSVTPIYKSEWIKDNLNPEFKPFKLDVNQCGGFDSPLTVEILDYDTNGRHGTYELDVK
jgi:hypothetical protein